MGKFIGQVGLQYLWGKIKYYFVTALGTSGNYLTWTKNGTTNNITVPFATKAQKDANGNVITDKYIPYGAALLAKQSNNVYITKEDNSLYGAAQRFVVTHKYYNTQDNSYIGDERTTELFNGNYEIYSKNVTTGRYGEVYIGKETEENLASTTTKMWTYGLGTIYCNFYSNWIPETITAKVASLISNETVWTDRTVTRIGTSAIFAIDVSYIASGISNIRAIKIRYSGGDFVSGGVTYGTSLSEIEMLRVRISLQELPIVTKYPIPQELLGNVTAPKFITSGGTSSQFVKGNGSLDSTAYAPKASPALTGTPTAPTATTGTNTTQIATTAFVKDAIDGSKVIVVNAATLPSTLDPNKVYNLGTLTGTVTIPAFSSVDANDNEAKVWCFTFSTSTTAPTITWPAGITAWNGGNAPAINASKSYEISVMNGIGVVIET